MIYFPVDKKQREVITCPAKNILYIAGRRVGKTRGVFRGRMYNALLTRRDFGYWYITPSYSQLIEEYEAAVNSEVFRRRITRNGKQPYPKMELRNGSYCGFRTFDRPENLRGSGLMEIGFDEINEIDTEDEFLAVINPLLKDARALTRYGNLVAMGQFRGRNWVFRRMYLPGVVNMALVGRKSLSWLSDHLMERYSINVAEKDLLAVQDQFSLTSDRLDYAAYITSAYDGLIYQSPEMQAELDRERKSLPRIVFEQEYLCIPVANRASVFRYEDIQAAIVDGVACTTGMPGRRYLLTADLGRVIDQCGILIFDVEARTIVYEELRPPLEKHHLTAMHIANLRKAFGNAQVVVDTTGGATGGHTSADEYVKLYRKQVPSLRSFVQNFTNKSEAVKALSLALEQGTIKISRSCQKTLYQLESYEYSHKGDRVTFHGPGGHQDDLVSATYMGIYMLDRGWAGLSGGDRADSVLE